MPTLFNMIGESGHLDSPDAEWLHHLVGDWNVLADISFSDLFLMLPSDDSYLIAAHCRPATASTMEGDDVVGSLVWEELREPAGRAMQGERAELQVRGMCVTLVPVRHGQVVLAVLGLFTNVRPDVTPDQVRTDYGSITESLLGMISRGEFPAEDAPSTFKHGTPRVSDGFVHLDADGVVLYASPNAVSAFHRLGIKEALGGQSLAEKVTETIEDHSMVDEALPVVIMGRATWATEVESRGVVLSLRAIQLLKNGTRQGAVLLCRDITELRRSERKLMTKDAMIREINHRVKNNLQTVSALLRLQSRRAEDPQAKASLDDAQRRIYTISMVHEALARTGADTLDFDDTLSRLMRLAAGVAATGQTVVTKFEGSFGQVHAEEATALAVVLNELVTNAVEHGLAGRDGKVTVRAHRNGEVLDIDVIDDGRGIGEQDEGSGLGTQIVQTMVKSDLLGHISWRPVPTGGTRVSLQCRVRSRD